jgi:hypothetical protein
MTAGTKAPEKDGESAASKAPETAGESATAGASTGMTASATAVASGTTGVLERATTFAGVEAREKSAVLEE